MSSIEATLRFWFGRHHPALAMVTRSADPFGARRVKMGIAKPAFKTPA
jgi:hypothetical protein